MSLGASRREFPGIAAWDDKWGHLASLARVLPAEVGGWTTQQLADVHARAVEGHEEALGLYRALPREPRRRTDAAHRKLAIERDALYRRLGEIDAVRRILEAERAGRALRKLALLEELRERRAAVRGAR